jgi:hypothetical protein
VGLYLCFYVRVVYRVFENSGHHPQGELTSCHLLR